MKLTPRKNAAIALKDALDYLPISEAQAFKIARVDRRTWARWRAGKSSPPAATVELIRLAALGEPTDPAFTGFQFVRGIFYDDHGNGYTPGDVRLLAYYKQCFYKYIALQKSLEPRPVLGETLTPGAISHKLTDF